MDFIGQCMQHAVHKTHQTRDLNLGLAPQLQQKDSPEYRHGDPACGSMGAFFRPCRRQLMAWLTRHAAVPNKKVLVSVNQACVSRRR